MVDESTRDELVQLLATRSTALVQGDPAFFTKLLADDFTYTNAGGQLFDKAAYLEFFIRSGHMRWYSQDLADLDFRRHGDVVVLTCRIHDRASHRGEDFDAHFRSTQVFVKHPDGWKYLAGQTTTISPSEEEHRRIWTDGAARRDAELDADPTRGRPASEVFRDARARLR